MPVERTDCFERTIHLAHVGHAAGQNEREPLAGEAAQHRQIGEIVGADLDGRDADLEQKIQIRPVLGRGHEDDALSVAFRLDREPGLSRQLTAAEHGQHGFGDFTALRPIGVGLLRIADELLGFEGLELDGVSTRLLGGSHHVECALDFAVVVYARLGNDEGGVSGPYSPSLDDDLRHSVVLERRSMHGMRGTKLRATGVLIVTGCDPRMELILYIA